MDKTTKLKYKNTENDFLAVWTCNFCLQRNVVFRFITDKNGKNGKLAVWPLWNTK